MIELKINITITNDNNQLTNEKEFTKLLNSFSKKEMRQLINFLKLYFDKKDIENENQKNS